MLRPPRCYLTILMTIGILPGMALAQNFLPLDFSQNVQQNNSIYPNNSTLGPEYYSGLTMDFINVTNQNGQVIDARVTVLGTAGNYNFVGYIPDYNQSVGQPEGDLGVYYRHDGDFTAPTGGIAYTLSFFEGGGTFSTAAVLSDFRILIYDHDGEPGQAESIRTYNSDGFTGHQNYNGSGITALDEEDSWRFDSGGMNKPEDGPQGGFLAYYQNTSSIRFDLFATTLPSNPAGNNGIFVAFDGDLSLTNGQTGNFGTFVPVPEPSAFSLTACALTMVMMRRRRS